MGPMSVGRGKGGYFPKVGPNLQLQTYQNALKKSLEDNYPGIEMITHEVELKFYFWRILEEWENLQSGRTNHDHDADTTNLQKGTEDALQGLLIKNDKQVKACSGVIIHQGSELSMNTGLVIIRMSNPHDHESEIPSKVWDNVSAIAPLEGGMVEFRLYVDPEELF